ncbi:hypothetical protein [Coleofasciculus chthonoplastes]|uniref:hypothetical protein n=1 Tax=Coleofasciculus chthonoplastes TaxID=64178 RepID=UPI0032F1FA49
MELEEETISLPLVELVPEIRGSYIQFLSDTIVEGTKTLLEHLEQPNTADVLDDDKYRLRKAIADIGRYCRMSIADILPK